MNPYRLVIICLILFVFTVIFFAPHFLQHEPTRSHLENALKMPGRDFILGTDANGRDILAQVLYGARSSLLISVAVVAASLAIGLIIGFLAGYHGGFCDRIFLTTADVFQAFPGILLAIFIAAFLPASIFNLIFLLSFVGWVGYARVVRAQVIEIKSREFILAGRAIGVTPTGLMTRYFLPNMLGPLIIQACFGMAGVILAESTLSFLGLGLPEHVPSLGKLLDSGVNLLLVAPHVALFPGLALMLLVLFFNLTGDWITKPV